MISNPTQLIELLNKLPGQIRDQERMFILSNEALDLKKLEMTVAKSNSILKSTGNATEKNAQAVVDTVTEAIALINAQKDTDLEEASLKYLENKFTSLRKISTIETELIRTQLTGV